MKRAILLAAAIVAVLWAIPAPAETAHNLLNQYRFTGPYDLSAIPELMRGNVNVFFVDNEAANASDTGDGRHGESLDYPFKTIDYAIGKCTASKGDVILVAPRSGEEKAATGILNTVDVIGVSIIGLGEGANKPTIALSGNTGAVAFSVTAAGVTIRNFLITNAQDALTKALNIAAADCKLQDIEVRDGASSTECAVGILTTAAAARLKIDNFRYDGWLAGDATTAAIALNGVVDCKITNSWFRGGFLAGAVDLRGVLSTGVVVDNCIFENGTTALTKDVVDTITQSKWMVTNSFDVVGGYAFAGGSGTALASYAPAAAAVTIGAGDVDAAAIATAAIDADAIAADAFGASELAADAVTEIWNNNLSAFAGAGYAGTYLKTLYDDWLDAGRLDVILDAILADTAAMDTAGEVQTLAGTAAISTTAVTSAPVEKTLADILHKDGSFTYDNTTDSLEALADKITTIDDFVDTEVAAILADTEAMDSEAEWANLASTVVDNVVAAMDANSTLATVLADTAAMDTEAEWANLGSTLVDNIVAAVDANSTSAAIIADLQGRSQLGDKIQADMDANSNLQYLTSARALIITDLAGISEIGDKIVADMDANSADLTAILTDTDAQDTEAEWADLGSTLVDNIVAAMDANSTDLAILNDLAGISQLGDKVVADMDANSLLVNWTLARANIVTDLAGISEIGDKIVADMDANSTDLAILNDLGGISQVGDKVQADMDANSILYWQPRVATVAADEVTQDLFAVAGGPIEILAFYGTVDVLIGATPTTCKIWVDATAGAASDIDFSTAVAITDDAVGTTYVFTSANPSVFTPLTGGAAGGGTQFAKTWYCRVGMIEQEMSADPGGAAGDHITWYMVWRPLAAGVTVTAQ